MVLSQNTAWSSPGGNVVLVDGEVRGITENLTSLPHNPSASHSSLHIFCSVNSTSINFPGQNLLSWPRFSWIQPPQRTRSSSSFLPGSEMAKSGWATGTTPNKPTKKQPRDPWYSHPPSLPQPAQPSELNHAVVWRHGLMTTRE